MDAPRCRNVRNEGDHMHRSRDEVVDDRAVGLARIVEDASEAQFLVDHPMHHVALRGLGHDHLDACGLDAMTIEVALHREARAQQRHARVVAARAHDEMGVEPARLQEAPVQRQLVLGAMDVVRGRHQPVALALDDRIDRAEQP